MRRHNGPLPRSWARSQADSAFAMPLVIPVVVLLLLGAVTLANRSMNTYLAATKQSDAQAARQAAESGMNRVLSALNPYGKGAGDPYISYLLASPWSGGWALAGQTSSQVRAILQQCRLSEQGVLLQQPPSPTVLSQLLNGTIGNSTTGSSEIQLRYEVIDYEPPQPSVFTTNTTGLPDCTTNFTSLEGGTARISVLGTVWRKAEGASVFKRMASYTLSRSLDVQSSPMAPVSPTWWVNRLPGYPIALRIELSTGNNGLNKLTSALYKNEDFSTASTSPVDLEDTFGKLRPFCGGSSACSPALTNGVSTLPTGTTYENKDLPPFPFSANSSSGTVPTGVTRASITGSKTNYPFTSSTSLNSLEPGCYKSEDIFPKRPGEIDCWISNITIASTPALLIVNTDLRPVNLIILNNVGSTTFPITLKHMHTVDGTANTSFDHAQVDSRLRWNRLRIFGRSYPSSGKCTGSSSSRQQVFIRAAHTSSPYSASLAGAFAWLPDGDLTYGVSGESTPSQLLSSWWVCNLKFNLTGSMKFILPLYGNPDALSAILPGGYFNSAVFTADSRFPVYPTMLRVRSSF